MDKKPILKTERLLLRLFHPDDASGFYDLNSDPLVMRFTGGDPPFDSVEHARNFILNYEDYNLYGYGRWTVELLENEIFIGWCGLKHHPSEGYTDLGYRFLREHWGKGYATEAAQACVDYGFEVLQLERIIGRVIPENLPSIKVLEKIGMAFYKKAPCGDFDGADYYRITRAVHQKRCL